VGELGVLAFGGGDVRTLHPLGTPFSDALGPAMVSAFSFAGEHTVADAPVGALLDSLDAQLTTARDGAAGGSEQLQQLVLVIADGHFHEKESLRVRMRKLERRGLLVAFIVLDPGGSLLEMQSVSFVGGKPLFTSYLDSFPFPFFTIVSEVATLPRTLCDLLRQWFELSNS
jgi:midasin